MSRRRIERVNEQLKREIAEIVHGEVGDPRIGAPVITAVRTAPDLTLARVYVAVPADEEARGRVLEGLRAATPFIRGELGRRLRLRRIPELRFEVDESMDRAQRIDRLLREALGEASDADRGGGAEREEGRG